MSSQRRRLGPPTRPGPELQPQLLWPPVYRTPRQEQFGWIAMIIAAVGALRVGAAVLPFGQHGHHRCTGRHDHDDETAPNDEPNEEPTEEPTAAGFTTRNSHFEIGIKILEKKCFGTASCSVTYRIKPKNVGTQELN